jgi:hypothetical protein
MVGPTFLSVTIYPSLAGGRKGGEQGGVIPPLLVGGD